MYSFIFAIDFVEITLLIMFCACKDSCAQDTYQAKYFGNAIYLKLREICRIGECAIPGYFSKDTI